MKENILPLLCPRSTTIAHIYLECSNINSSSLEAASLCTKLASWNFDPWRSKKLCQYWKRQDHHLIFAMDGPKPVQWSPPHGHDIPTTYIHTFHFQNYCGVPFTTPLFLFLICFDNLNGGFVSLLWSLMCDICTKRSRVLILSFWKDPVSEWYKTVNQQVQEWTKQDHDLY